MGWAEWAELSLAQLAPPSSACNIHTQHSRIYNVNVVGLLVFVFVFVFVFFEEAGNGRPHKASFYDLFYKRSARNTAYRLQCAVCMQTRSRSNTYCEIFETRCAAVRCGKVRHGLVQYAGITYQYYSTRRFAVILFVVLRQQITRNKIKKNLPLRQQII